jgi:ubiquinone/menaquinone biosynthesis C-methylase UbiE
MGRYDVLARFMEADAEEFFRRLPVNPAARLLDVGCGAGQLALTAARAGAASHRLRYCHELAGEGSGTGAFSRGWR